MCHNDAKKCVLASSDATCAACSAVQCKCAIGCRLRLMKQQLTIVCIFSLKVHFVKKLIMCTLFWVYWKMLCSADISFLAKMKCIGHTLNLIDWHGMRCSTLTIKRMKNAINNACHFSFNFNFL